MTKNRVTEYHIWECATNGILSFSVSGQTVKDAPRFAVRKIGHDWHLDHIPTGALVFRHRLKRQCELVAREVSAWSIYDCIVTSNDRLGYIKEMRDHDNFITYDEYLQFKD